MERILLGCFITICCISTTSAQQLIISQYYEGEGNDKWIEITNLGASVIDFTNTELYLCLFSNTSADNPLGIEPSFDQQIAGAISPGSSLIYRKSNALLPDYALADGIASVICNFDGDDLIIISTTKDETAWENRIDVIGNGTDWGSGRSLIRKPSETTGKIDFDMNDWNVITDLSLINNALPAVTERLGYHLFNCNGTTTQASVISVQSVLDITATITWINGDGSARLVLMKEGAAITEIPQNGVSYAGNSNFGSGDAIGGAYVVHAGFENSVDVSGLSANTTYHVRVFEFDCVPPDYLLSNVNTLSFTTTDPIPLITTDLNENSLDFGIVKPGNTSTTQTFLISGNNLLEDVALTVDPPFEISIDQSSWSQVAAIPVAQATDYPVYVRFAPTGADGSSIDLLTLSSSGAATIDIQMIGTALPNAWINEFHYDNIGGDTDEFIEIVLQNASDYDLEKLHVRLYNGSNGEVYDSKDLSQYIVGENINAFTLYYFDYGSDALQNGTEGISIDFEDMLIQFISYEGQVTGSGGPASGQDSEDIGVSQDGMDPPGISLQLVPKTGVTSGNKYEDFQWEKGAASKGLLNNNQGLPVELISFKGYHMKTKALLEWETASETSNKGFEIEKSTDAKSFKTIGFREGHGTTSQVHRYHFEDENFLQPAYYRLKQIDVDDSFDFSNVIFINKSFTHTDHFHIFPNPVKNEVSIRFNDDNSVDKSLSMYIYSFTGQRIFEFNGNVQLVNQKLNDALSEIPRGTYIVKFTHERSIELKMLIKD
ncbi:T9SS type A sorting domain-containing protein [Fulvivirgaceae bacterium BMA10]|uniref:T9SS type A sorting domain-containing protein n=1 Tax=Splendidivirga corallicola TaxID=3051826 RepID=A0ABT8KH68_9BACT|nr:T9SS type A sorting domain-containing protein [Fulvivirgaceae bacterium BMA10]